MSVPPLAERARPGLSETLRGPRDPRYCQSCGATHARATLQRWSECDAYDEQQSPLVVVVLCARCSKALIEPHARFYHPLDTNAPVPGAMGICVRCALRDALACTHVDRRALSFTWDSNPIWAHVRVAKPGRSGFRWFFPSPVRTCSGRVTHSPDTPAADDTPPAAL